MRARISILAAAFLGISSAPQAAPAPPKFRQTCLDTRAALYGDPDPEGIGIVQEMKRKVTLEYADEEVRVPEWRIAFREQACEITSVYPKGGMWFDISLPGESLVALIAACRDEGGNPKSSAYYEESKRATVFALLCNHPLGEAL